MSEQSNAAPQGGQQPEGQPGVEQTGQAAEVKTSQDVQVSPFEQIGFKNADEVLSLKTNFQEMKAEYDKMKAQSEVSPFANPLAERLNGLLKENAPVPAIMNFIKLQSIDLDTIPDSQAIREKMQIEYPTLTSEEIDAQMQDQYGEMGEDAAQNAKVSAKLKIAAQEAKKWLQEQKVATTNPEQEAKAQEQKAKAEQFQQNWARMAEQISESDNNLSFAVNKREVGGDYSFEFKPSIKPEDQAEISKMLTAYAVNNNIPLTEDGLRVLSEYKQHLLFNIYREEFLAEMAADVHASTVESFVRSGRPPQPSPGSGRQGEAPKKKTIERPTGFL